MLNVGKTNGHELAWTCFIYTNTSMHDVTAREKHLGGAHGLAHMSALESCTSHFLLFTFGNKNPINALSWAFSSKSPVGAPDSHV